MRRKGGVKGEGFSKKISVGQRVLTINTQKHAESLWRKGREICVHAILCTGHQVTIHEKFCQVVTLEGLN